MHICILYAVCMNKVHWDFYIPSRCVAGESLNKSPNCFVCQQTMYALIFSYSCEKDIYFAPDIGSHVEIV